MRKYGVTIVLAPGRSPAFYNDRRKEPAKAMQAMESAETIQIVVNGETKTVPRGLHVAKLLEFLAIDSARVAVELNRSIVRKRDWLATAVEEGAQIEVVWFVGGG